MGWKSGFAAFAILSLSQLSAAQNRAQNIYSEEYLLVSCQQNPRSSGELDCACFAKTYSEFKKEHPSPVSDSAGRREAYSVCRDFSAMRETEYKSCLQGFYRSKNIENKGEKCACYADEYVERFKELNNRRASTLLNVQKHVRTECFR